MKDAKLYTLIMAGGQGTRFWPESTSKKPKQYLNLISEKSLLEETILRFDGLIDIKHRYIVTVKEQEKLAKEKSNKLIGNDGLIFEPSGRNTAPCILLAIAKLIKDGASPEDVVTIVPADHVILNKDGFQEVLKDAQGLASSTDKIITIGITPTFPHTGYGYIHKGDIIQDDVYTVSEFKEKPNQETATNYLKTGKYLWNGGMFVSKIKTLLDEFKLHAKSIFAHYNDLLENIDNDNKLKAIYDKIPRDSIDYAVMEKSKNVLVIPSRFDWNDLGSWDALESVVQSNKFNTVINEDHDLFVKEAKGNIIFAPKKFVSLIGVNNLIVVSNNDNLLIMDKTKSQEVKSVVEYLKTK